MSFFRLKATRRAYLTLLLEPLKEKRDAGVGNEAVIRPMHMQMKALGVTERTTLGPLLDERFPPSARRAQSAVYQLHVGQ
ncbi:uncharacterized protein APUU_11655A [Aspergillus puulaauensis]|uniref:Uncharacterized protein n=1 Tax=Aspergillus puulaauensis TaxID=1220207 RepID=A0A7R7XCC9_9EURO|nr:uncharacterized protein APUU_11655A [Aspergillus puulaauensis]BCS18827.1 hypothetical protein APUU_11655A [Aspergillus puulaauensis]